MLKKLWYTILFISSVSYANNSEFALEYLSRDSQDGSFVAQRGIIGFDGKKNLENNYYGRLKTNLVFSSITSEQFIAKDEEESFSAYLEEFILGKKYKTLDTTLGIQSPETKTLATKSVYGPGLKGIIDRDSIRLSSSLLTIPSFRRFYINSNNETKRAQLWSSTLEGKIPVGHDLIKTSINYDYFSNLGPNLSYQSGLRGNSTVGTELTSEFLYDYSILSVDINYETYLSGLKVIAEAQFGENQSAYSFENKFSLLSGAVGNEQVMAKASILEIQKNSMIAIYTPQEIDSTGIRGVQGQLNYNIQKQISMNLSLGNYTYIDTNDEFQSGLMQITLRN